MAASTERSAFIRDMKKRQAEMTETAKTEASSGFLSDQDIIALLELDDTKKQFRTKISRVRYGKYKEGKEIYFAFNWVIIDGIHKGVTISKFVGMEGKTKTDREKKYKQLFGTFQRLDVDTTQWEPDDIVENAVEAADTLSKKKPGCLLSLSTWGDDPEDLRLNIDIVSMLKITEEEAEDDTPKTSAKMKTKVKRGHTPEPITDANGNKYAAMGMDIDQGDDSHIDAMEEVCITYGFDSSEYGDWESLGKALDKRIQEVNDGGEEYVADEVKSAIDFNEYVDCEATYNSGEAEIKVSTTAYDSDSEMFSMVDDNGTEYEGEWNDLDFGNGYGEEA